MNIPEYPHPDFVPLVFDYRDWLIRKAKSMRARDRDRWGGLNLTQDNYRTMIHNAISGSNGRCYFTRELLDWNLLGEPFRGDPLHPMNCRLHPTVDHLDPWPNIQLVVCGGLVNDAKSNLPYGEFVALCRQVIECDRQRQDRQNGA